MADTAAPAKGLGKTLGKKVGPLPLGIWLAGGVGLLWYFHKQQAAASTAPAGTTSQTGYGTDPAGNTGYIDPSTGYVYGSAEDINALQSQGLVGANSYNTGGTGATSGTGASGSSVDTGSGGSAAPGVPVNPSGTPVATPGAPPGPTTPTPGAAAPKSNSWQYPAPTGLTAYNVTSGGCRVKWNPVQGPNGQHPGTYTVACYQMNGKKVDQFVSGATDTAEYGAGGTGLHPGWQYRINVWANGGPVAPQHASIVVTLKPKGG